MCAPAGHVEARSSDLRTRSVHTCEVLCVHGARARCAWVPVQVCDHACGAMRVCGVSSRMARCSRAWMWGAVLTRGLAHTIHVCLFFLLAPLLHAEQGFGSACPRCFIVLVCVRACMCARARASACYFVRVSLRSSVSRDAAISGPQFFQEKNKDERELGVLLYSCSWVGL